jgi:hypothetical protein
MKKFGTPIGAAPGSAKENVGFDDVGTPPLPRGLAGLEDFFCLFVLAFCDCPVCERPPW